ncbi:hypothetical protein [uncultured Megamonas sp.]|uniref:hypothetical protein n=1 Tax=uncultured Megamonas sp. TaxID=286140 RepID=UPI00259B4F37|nr:hypothetical protein [uncultured Megamonas sp.]
MKKNKLVIGLVSLGLLGGVVAPVSTQVSAKTIKSSSSKVKQNKVVIYNTVDNNNKTKVTINTNDVALMNYNDGEKTTPVLLVKATVKNIGKETRYANPDNNLTFKQENKKGVLTTLHTKTMDIDDLPSQYRDLYKNNDKDLEKGSSVDTLITLELDGNGNVTIKPEFDGKGKATIKDISKLQKVAQAKSSEDETNTVEESSEK